jgi:asparagine synthase (glutamine-hydrolysing)
MCGIAGFVLREGAADASRVRLMCDQIRHRGPDDEGYYVDGACALGMRRLSIIDLETGHQPIANEDNSVHVVFNGEIYNYRQLRADLEAHGHLFLTATDTETLVHSYEEHGVDSLWRLRGMFALAIWDSRQRRLLLARDRLGKKPLYYALLPQGLWFASELKCFRVAGIPLDIDQEALRLYFQFTYIPEPATPFRQVRKLVPGSWLSYSPDGQVHEGRYWRFPAPAEKTPDDMTEEQAIEDICRLFDESVKLRMISDVPLGAFLSGGIDSGLVVASMTRQTDRPVQTFSIGFEEEQFNELPAARLVADMYSTDHHEIIVKPDAIDLVSKIVHNLDEPVGDSSAIPTYIVSEFASKHVKVALSGDGGDELFGGYESLLLVDRARRFDRIPLPFRRAIRLVADHLPYSFYGKNYLRMVSRPNDVERYFDLNFSPFYLRDALLADDWALPADNAYLWRMFADTLGPQASDILTRVVFFEATTHLTSDMLTKVDRMSMANSLEVRCPFLDQKLTELAMRIPHTWKLNGQRGKQILLKALGKRLPADLLRLPKRGFAVPLAKWLRGPLNSFLRDHLLGPRFLSRGIVSPGFVEKLILEHESGRRDNRTWLWMLLTVEIWFEQSALVPEGAAA